MINQDKSVSKLRVSGGDFRQMLAVGTALLAENVDLINGLNVFPVPDGDTGTNMLLTMQSAMEEVSKVTSDDFAPVAHAAAHGSLMGARGNSGVILSQILRGMARSADGRSSLDALELARALKEGAATAYRGIGKPVEGTILTVARESADAAVAVSDRERDVVSVVRRAVEAASDSLAGTPELLPVLKEAGVVDAGGQGYLLVLEGAEMFLTGRRAPAPVAVPKKTAARAMQAALGCEYGYCTELLVLGPKLNADRLREQLDKLGNSVIVAGEDDLIHLHVHTQRPGDVLNLASSFGSLDKVKVENMQMQHTAYVGGEAEATLAQGTAIVAVAAGDALARVFRDLGASVVVPGGQTMNPSIEELVRAVSRVARTGAILLPNNPNVIMTAQQAGALVRADLRVVPTRTIPEGVAAMIAFNPEADLGTNEEAMRRAAAAVQTIEVTRAVRSTRANGLEIKEGQGIAILNGVLVEAGDSLDEIIRRALDRAAVGEHEVATIYCGEGVSLEEGRCLAASINARWPDVQVEVVEGGQPHYPYILSVE